MEVSLQQMCRTCLGAGVALISLHVSSGTSQTCTVAEMLGKCTTVEVSENDGLPSKVCLSCVSEIKRSYFFKIKCESSQDTLQQYLKEVSAVSEVSVSSDTNEVVKQEAAQNGGIFLSNYTITQATIKAGVSTEVNEAVIAEQVAEILDSNDYHDDEVVEDLADEELLEVHAINDENFEISENRASYELNEYLDNSSDGDTQQDRVVILACEECCYTFESKEEFQAHAADCNKNHEGDSSIAKNAAQRSLKKCPECPMDFVHQKNLEKHIKKCHQMTDAMPQDECGSTQDEPESRKDVKLERNGSEDEDELPLAESLPEDAILKHDPASLPSGEFSCPRCGAGFVNNKSLKCHMKINKCTVKQFMCRLCRKVFINDKSLIEHIKSHAKTFKCSKCTKSFSKAEKLQAHTDKVHNGIMKNQCKFCGKVFTMFSTLKDHLRTHSGEKPFLCSICGKGFSQNTNLKQHVMRHKNLKPFACKDCDLSFVSKGELNAHVRKHTGDHPFRCNICRSSFTTSSSLVKHKRIHTGERPYACDLCPMRFSALGTLKNHRRTHTGEKPFQCEYCSRSFAQKSDCVTHMRSHTGERPYTCPICGWGFPQSGTLKSHMKTHERERQREAKGKLSKSGEETQTTSVNETEPMNVDEFKVYLKCNV